MTSIINSLSLVVVPYIGTWIETIMLRYHLQLQWVVPYIGTWIETVNEAGHTVTTVKSYLI